MLELIGRCSIDIEKIRKNLPELVVKERLVDTREDKDYKSIWSHIYDCPAYTGDNCSIFRKAYDITYVKDLYWSGFANPNSPEEKKKIILESFNKMLEKWLDEIKETNYILKCYYQDEVISLVGASLNSEVLRIFPSKYVKVEQYKDYSNLTGAERRALLGSSDKDNHIRTDASIISLDEKSINDVVKEKIQTENKVDNIKAQIEDIKNSRTDELAKLQAEIDKKVAELNQRKQKLIEVLDQKKEEMEQELEKLEMTIYKLDSEIYAIRCYTGEILELKKIRSGKSASEDTPLVFYQKLRYLDEELGKIASIYNVDFDDAKYFEKLLICRDDVFNVFAPSARSLMLVRVSKSGVGYTTRELNHNLLETYEKYLGKKVAIILRDGENLYLAWTDDEKISFSNEAFYKVGYAEVTDAEKIQYEQKPYESDKSYQKRIKQLNRKNMNEQLGRYYIFSIVQGILDRHLISFPEKVQLPNSPYIIMSYADGWISTNKYGQLNDMIDRCNRSVKKGDFILTTQSLIAHKYSGSWVNDRGRGEKNRTHDVSAVDCAVYPINLVEHEAKYLIEHRYLNVYNKEVKVNSSNYLTDEMYDNFMKKEDISSYTVSKEDGSDTYHYYVSLEKAWSYSGARANFEVYKNEFINLTFMNSVWLQYVITNQKTSNINIGGQTVDFAHLLPYLKKALQFTKEREETAAEYISKIYPELLKNEEWPVLLSEWMLDKDVHNLSEFRIKQFVKQVKG